MKKQILAFAVAIALVFTCVTYFGTAAANNDITVMVDGRQVVFLK